MSGREGSRHANRLVTALPRGPAVALPAQTGLRPLRPPEGPRNMTSRGVGGVTAFQKARDQRILL